MNLARGRTIAIFCLAAALCAVVLVGQGFKFDDSHAPAIGAITTGTNSFEYNSFGAGTEASVDFFVPNGTDHQFGNWWAYRVTGASDETWFPAPDFESYVGDMATLMWGDVDGLGLFSAELTLTIADAVAGATLTQIMVVTNTNPTGAPLDINLFHYNDTDLDATAGSDSADSLGVTAMEISESSTSFYDGVGASGYAVGTFPNIRNLFSDGVPTTLGDTGLPFGPADFSGAFQWIYNIPPQGSQTTVVNNDVAGPIPVELIEWRVD